MVVDEGAGAGDSTGDVAGRGCRLQVERLHELLCSVQLCSVQLTFDPMVYRVLAIEPAISLQSSPLRLKQCIR